MAARNDRFDENRVVENEAINVLNNLQQQHLNIEAALAALQIQHREMQENLMHLNQRNDNNPVALAPVAPLDHEHAEAVLKSLQTPQIIRDLPSFDGNPVKLHSFIKSIDTLMPMIEAVRNTNMYAVWMQCIRSKITAEADTVLELYGTDLDWNEIKMNLITHYSDKRDEVSLTRDLFKLSQSTNPEEFYSKVSHVISLLINLLNLNEVDLAVKNAKNELYQQMGLKVFLAGLKDPLGPIIRAQTPRSLKEALRLCLEENNYHYAKESFKPTLPPRNNQKNFSRNRQFPPQPNPFRNNFSSNYSYPARPNHPKSFNNSFSNPFSAQKFQQNRNNHFNRQPENQRQTPMDVDNSIRSRQVNYINRSFQNRQQGNPFVQHAEPRFHVEELQSTEQGCNQYLEHDEPNYSRQRTYPREFTPYNYNVSRNNEEQTENTDDLNFRTDSGIQNDR